MNELKIIKSSTKKCNPENKAEIYLNAIQRLTDKNNIELSKTYNDINKDILKQYIYLLIMYVNASSRTYRNNSTLSEETTINRFNLIDSILDLLSLLTPKEFVNMFPIEKVYDGEKYQSKDYFSTIEALKSFKENEMIGDKIVDLLWDYRNKNIIFFNVELMMSTSNMCKIRGEETPAEKFMKDNNLSTYSYNEEHKYMINNQTGEFLKVKPCKKRVPKNLEIIKGGIIE
nr:hypothetical protein [Sedimentibacter sp.]